MTYVLKKELLLTLVLLLQLVEINHKEDSLALFCGLDRNYNWQLSLNFLSIHWIEGLENMKKLHL
jgi:hypothetical protein